MDKNNLIKTNNKLVSVLRSKVFVVISSIFYIVIFTISIWIYNNTLAPDNFPTKPTYILIPHGSSIDKTAQILKEENIIKNPEIFKFWTKFRYKKIKSGDYLFKAPENLWTVSRRLAGGKHGLTIVKILVKEGETRKQIAKTLSKKMLRFNIDKFLLLTEGKEGYLFPDTYHFLPNATEEKIVKTMLDNFNKKISKYKQDIEMSKMTLNEIITLASLVEREAGNKKDRKMIAGVLLNRLRIGMPLQVDVTWFYTHNKGTPGITLKDLSDKNNPYNTYRHKGLPPTPIGSPSISSIEAVLHPTINSYLFYLADRKGRTYYSKTYTEHLRKRDLYLKK